jgi:pimeloyl-ACP methyl ester carboxylesterase
MPESSEHSITTEGTSQLQSETLSFGHGEIMKVTPAIIRIDQSTGEKVRPLLFVQGIKGDKKLPWTLEAFAAEDQREVVAVNYTDKLKGSGNPVEMPGLDATTNTITEMDVNQADELVSALDVLGIDQVDAVGESRGAIRLVAAMKKHPELFRHVYLAHPAGQDDRTFVQAHFDAARQGLNHAGRKALRKVEPHQTDGLVMPRGGRLLRDPRGWRKEHKSVAHANLHNALSEIAESSPEKDIIIAGDANDKAFLPSRLQANKGEHVRFVETDWGGHGVGFNRKAVREIVESFHKAEGKDDTTQEEESSLDLDENMSTPEKEGYTIQVTNENYGHGNVDVVMAVPPGMDEDAFHRARKLIYVPGHSPSGKNELRRLRQDLLALAASRTEASQGTEPVVAIGVSFTGERANNPQLVEGFPNGVKVSKVQLEKAQDIVSATTGLIEGNNAELVGFSAGGPVAQIALELGLPADTVGLFNAGGLDNKDSYRTHARVMGEQVKAIARNSFDKSGDPKEEGTTDSHWEEEYSRSFWDRIRRARAEQTSAGRGRTHLLVGEHPEVNFVVGISKKDSIYPRRRVEKVFREMDAQNVTFVDLDWIGHALSTDSAVRSERLGLIAQEMGKARNRV